MLHKHITSIILTGLTTQAAFAADSDGTWSFDGAGTANWSDTTKWTDGAEADGIGFTANFSNNITADRIVTLDSDRTIGNILFSDAVSSTAGGWTIAGANTLNLDVASGSSTITVNNASGGVGLGTGKTATISADLTGADGIIKAGNGTLVLSGDNNFTGVMRIDLGRVQISGSHTSTLGFRFANAAANLDFMSGSITSLTATSGSNGIQTSNGFNASSINVAGTVTNAGILEIRGANSGSGFNLNDGADWTQSGSLTIRTANSGSSAVMTVNSGALFKYTGTAAINLSNASGSGGGSGTLHIAGGVLETQRGFSNQGGTGGGSVNLRMSGSGTLKLTANVGNLASGLSGPSDTTPITIQLGTGGGIVNTNGFSTTINQGIVNFASQTGSLTKQGSGTLTLNGANGYTGATTVSGGTLLVNGSTDASSAVDVGINGTLGGTGVIGGSVNVTGMLSPGASIESFSSASLTMNSGSTFLYEAADNSATGADMMVVNGALSLTAVNLDLTGADLTLGSWAVNDRLTLISYTGAPVTSGFVGFADDTAYTFGANQWLFDYNSTESGNNFKSEATGTSFVTLTMVPEPSVAMLGGLGVLVLMRRRRNRA